MNTIRWFWLKVHDMVSKFWVAILMDESLTCEYIMANKGNDWIQQEKSPPLHKKSKSCALNISYGEIVFPHNGFLETQILIMCGNVKSNFTLSCLLWRWRLFMRPFYTPSGNKWQNKRAFRHPIKKVLTWGKIHLVEFWVKNLSTLMA
jgi:hypothetical protein